MKKQINQLCSLVYFLFSLLSQPLQELGSRMAQYGPIQKMMEPKPLLNGSNIKKNGITLETTLSCRPDGSNVTISFII